MFLVSENMIRNTYLSVPVYQNICVVLHALQEFRLMRLFDSDTCIQHHSFGQKRNTKQMYSNECVSEWKAVQQPKIEKPEEKWSHPSHVYS